MTMQLDQPSAKIYPFPAGGRSTRADCRAGEQAPEAPPFDEAGCAGSWYHEAALEEAELACKIERLVRSLDRC
jgi:hypothetical protein